MGSLHQILLNQILKTKITDFIFQFKILLEGYSTQELKNLDSQESAHEFPGSCHLHSSVLKQPRAATA